VLLAFSVSILSKLKEALAVANGSPDSPISKDKPLKIADKDLLTNIVEVRTVESVSGQPEEKVNNLADNILSLGGIVKPPILERTGINSFQAKDGSLQVAAQARAREKNLVSGESFSAFISQDKEQTDRLLKQRELISKYDQKSSSKLATLENPGNVKEPVSSIVEVRTVESDSDRQFDQKDIDDVARLILESGNVVNPPLLERTGINSFKVLRGDFQFKAQQRARELNLESGQNMLSFIVDDSNKDLAISQYDNT